MNCEPSAELQLLADTFLELVYKGPCGEASMEWMRWLELRDKSVHDETPTMQLITAIVRAQLPVRRRKWRDR